MSETARVFSGGSGKLDPQTSSLVLKHCSLCVSLDWRSIHSVCTIRKLRFLHWVMTNEESICYRAFSALVDNVKAFSLVRDCRELEGKYRSDFTSQILSASNPTISLCVLKEAKEHSEKKDKAFS